jgi:hypothetical protein
MFGKNYQYTTHANRRGATFCSKTFAYHLRMYKANGDVIFSLLVVACVSFHAGS